MPKFMTDAEEMANRLCGQRIFDIEGVKDIEYPVDLNAFIIVMNNEKKYLVEVSEYTEEDYQLLIILQTKGIGLNIAFKDK